LVRRSTPHDGSRGDDVIREPKGKTALVTGASRGIGVYIARALAKEGMNLVLTARDKKTLEGIVAECEQLGVKALAVAADVSRAEDRERLVREAAEIVVLVNNAVIEVAIAFNDQTEPDFTKQLKANCVAPLDLTRRVLPSMI